MTVLIAYAPEKSGKPTLALGAALAQARGEDIRLVHVVRRTWHASPGNADAEFRQWAAESADEATAQGVAELADLAPGVVVHTHHIEGRSVPNSLLEAIETLKPCVVVLGSGSAGALGQVSLGSTANRLAHSSPVPVALAPRGYRYAPLERVTAAWTQEDDVDLLGEMLTFAKDAGVPARAVTFGLRAERMYPPEVGLDAEDEVFVAWHAGASAALQRAASSVGLAEADTEVSVGEGWRDAVDGVEWHPGDLLAIGSHGGGIVKRVFLGSSASRILRNSPVPVAVFPG